MTKKERVTVDFDSESYYLDGEFWESWDNYGEEMANTINKLLNEQENKLNQIKKLCMDNRIPVCLTAHIPKNCEHYHDCFENHTENAVSFGESKIANKILKIVNGDVE